MNIRLKKALLAAIAVFASVLTGYSFAPEAIEALCVKVSLCEVVK
jgi:hypothetical protein